MENKYPKLTLKDLTQGVKLSAKEILEYEKIIEKLNQIAEQNPEYIDYLKERYPKSDPRLSQIRYKMDQMLSASEEYIETQFPENKEQTLRVKKILARNIELSDPKTFKDPKPPLTYGKLYGNDSKNKKVKIKDLSKKSAGRFLKKEKKKDTSRTRWLKG